VSSIWSLPGPAQFAEIIRTRVDRGNSVVVGLPGWAVGDGGFCSGLLRAIDRGPDEIDDSGAWARPLASLVADWFSIDDVEPGPDAPAALARHRILHGRVIAIRIPSDDEHSARWAGFARKFAAAARAVEIAERPRLILLSRKTCAAALAGSEPLVSDLWWWGVLDRLDTALHVRGRLAGGPGGSGGSDQLVRDAITEVAGFDLRLADHLAGGWDGSYETLPAELKRFGDSSWPPPHALPESLPHSSTALGVPPAPLLPIWDQGLADRWDAFPVYLHACVVPSAADLRSRVWRAQIRVLMPTIDEERARIEAWLRREVRALPSNGAVLEPGDLYTVLQDHPNLKTWRGGDRKRLIYWLRETRNTLAHMGTLTPGDVSRGRRLIADDRRHG
jgi:hypothetical protein